MSNERDVLKSLLIKEELDLLSRLEKKLLSEEQFTQEVSKVLSKAIRRAQKEDKSFEKSLSVPIKKGVIRAFSESKQSIIDALLPIMGKLIRKSVTNSIKQFVTDINRTLELGFSVKALKWRWQALKADVTFADMVFQKTIRYQVNEIFLINKENGLLIEHVGVDDMLKDNDSISAMLTAIQDFIGDSLKTEDSNLENIEISDLTIKITTGPQAYLAIVVKGSPTERFKQKFQVLIEDIHAEYTDVLLDENNYRNNESLSNHLRTYLLSKSLTDENNTKKPSMIPWVFAFLIIVGSFAYWKYTSIKNYNRAVNAVSSIPGLYVQSIKKTGSHYIVKALKDPLAEVDFLQGENIKLDTKPFISLEKELIKKRVDKVLKNYKQDSVKASLLDNTLLLEGTLSKNNQNILINQLSTIAGIEAVNDKTHLDYKNEIKKFLAKYQAENNSLRYDINQSVVTLSGKSSYETNENIKKQFKQIFPMLSLQSKVEVLNSNEKIIQFIESNTINFKDFSQMASTQLNKIINSLQTLDERQVKIRLEIIGQSDCNGHKSNQFSQQRANKIALKLIERGIDKDKLIPTIKSCKDFKNKHDDSKLNVSFKVKNNK